MHAKAEEDLFYPALLEVGEGAGGRESAAAKTKHAIKDHNEIRDAVAAVADHTVGTQEWRAALAKANDANSDHMGEEEREGLTDFRLNASVEARQALAVRFAAFQADNINGVLSRNVDPDRFVRENQ